jgi:hypothetical protein
VNPAVTSLIAKELYMNRWAITGMLLAGIVSLGLCLLNPVGIAVGALGYLAGLIAYGCMLAMGIWKEREQGSLLFSVSLPVSARGYLTARTLGALCSYLAAWIPLLIGAVVTIRLSSLLPHGMTLFITLLCVFLLLEFCLLVAVALLTRSEGPLTGTLIVTNTVVSLYWWGIANIPSVARTMRAPDAIWDGTALGILAVEVVLVPLLLLLPIQLGSRRSLL